MAKGWAILAKKVPKIWQFIIVGFAVLLLAAIIITLVALLTSMKISVQF